MDVQESERKRKEEGCGYGNCYPKCVQPCANIKAYTANLSIILLLHIAFYTYFVGVMRTLEKRFGLSSAQTGILNSINDFLQLFFVITIGYLGRNANKARLLSMVVFFTAVASFIYAAPYFVFGSKDIKSSYDDMSVNGSLISNEGYKGKMCDAQNSSQCGSQEERTSSSHQSVAAFGIIALGCVIIGIGGSSNSTLGLTYIEENVSKKDSSIYVGVVVSMYPWGPIVGFLLAGLCVSIPENLRGSSVPSTDPNYIGAWWLGYVIIGIVVFITIIPLFFFPKKIRGQKKNKPVDITETKKKEEHGNVVIYQIKEFGKMFYKLFKNKIFWTHTFSQVCNLYVVVGVLIQQPRFLEAHYHQSAGMASIISAVSGAVSGVIGTMLGGYILRRFKLQLPGIAALAVFASFVAALGTAVKLLLPCPAIDMVGQLDPVHQNSLILESTCNMNCTCGVDRMEPICVGGTQTFFSACYAGCTTYKNGTLGDCSCISPHLEITPGTCETTCELLIPYIVGYFIITLISLTGRVPSTILTLRIVDDDMRSFGLAIVGALLSLLVFIPGPILFGGLVDSTCLIWQESCGKRGSCLFYDIERLRLLPHGVTLCFQVAGALLSVLTWWLVRREKSVTLTEEGDNKEVPKITSMTLTGDIIKEEKISSL